MQKDQILEVRFRETKRLGIKGLDIFHWWYHVSCSPSVIHYPVLPLDLVDEGFGTRHDMGRRVY